MDLSFAVLPGDGIGPEVMQVTLDILEVLAKRHGHTLRYEKALIGGSAYEVHSCFFPEETKQVCRQANAILFGNLLLVFSKACKIFLYIFLPLLVNTSITNIIIFHYI